MNEKPFFEVFRTLQVDGQLHSLFEQVMVTRVSTNPGRDVLRVYIVSKKLIAKDQLFHIAKQIQRQVFGTRKTQVYLFEKFQCTHGTGSLQPLQKKHYEKCEGGVSG